MATPSVLTVPSMYGDGILYSGPTAFGPELVTNGTFDTDSNWTKTGSWQISSGVAYITSPYAPSYLYQSLGLIVGKTYKIEINIVSISSGNIRLRCGNSAPTQSISDWIGTLGRHTIYLPCGGLGDIFWIESDNSFIGSIDNVSVKEITQGSDFEFTRATTGTRINEEGYIEDVPYNLLTYSTDFTFWTQADTSTVQIEDSFNGSGDAYKVSITGGSGFQTIRKTGLNISGQQTFSIYAKKDTLNFTRILFGGVSRNFWVDLVNGTQGTTTGSYDSITITNAGNGFFRIVATFTPTSPVTHVYLYPSIADGNVVQTSGSVIFQYAQLVKGDQPKNYLPTTDRVNLPRLNYPVYGGCPSLLVEPQRTNTVQYSQDFSPYLVGGTITITTGFLAPDGTNSASKIQGVIGNSSMYLAGASSGTATRTIWARSVSGTGTVGLLSYYLNQNRLFTVTEEWQRFEISGTTTPIGDTNFYAIDFRDTSQTLSEIIIWGAQSEEATYATSYIPTSGSTVTRNEDKALYAGLGTTDTFNDNEGVLFIETEALFNNNDARIISINAGNGLNRVTTGYPSSGDSSIVAYLQSTAGSGAQMTITGIDTTQKHKIAFKYKLNDSSIFIDGVKRGVDTNVAMPVGLKQLDFTNGVGTGVAEYRGNLNAIAVYKTALTDTELANLTSYNNHDLFIPYRSRMQMIGADQELQCTEHDITRFL